MCEIFGACTGKSCFYNEYLKEFYSHSKEHPHGWGLACINSGEVMLEKEPVQASRSNYLKERLSVPVEAGAVLAHIRYATIGNVEYKNCHPFCRKDNRGRNWTMVHNGTIFEYKPLEEMIHRQHGDTDSERILMYLVESVSQEETSRPGGLRETERFRLVESLISDMAKGNKLNFILFDGEYMYVHTNYKDSLYYLQKEEEILVATSPLGREKWEKVPMMTLLVYKEGELVYEGESHGQEYVDSEENMKFLYQIFSGL